MRWRAHPVRGFTLIEVMVALLILAVMSGMAWKGVDGIVKAREIADANVRRTLRLQSVMTQWQADLNALHDTQTVPAWQFDGAALRITRETPGGMQVVVWALRSGRWVRWAGQPVTTVGQLQEQWSRSLQLQGREPGSLAALKGVEQWQLYTTYTGDNGSWSNAQSSAGTVAPPASTPLGGALNAQGSRQRIPLAFRSVLSLGEGSGYQGRITRDILLAAQPGQ